MPDAAKKRIVIIGSGAAGVFTAYLLEKGAPGKFDITILEESPVVGGHAHSRWEPSGNTPVLIEHGAQFFSEDAQPDYCDMLRHEQLFDQVIQRDADVTIWHQTRDELLFRIPDSIWGILLAALSDVTNWLCFGEMVSDAREFWNDEDWDTTFGTWIDDLDFWFASDADTKKFKDDILRPLMYQFGLVPPDKMNELSARFVLFYFLGSLPKGFDLTPFTIYNSSIGLHTTLKLLLEKYGLLNNVVLDAKVDEVKKSGDHWVVETTDGTSYDADEVVFSINPMRILAVLPQAGHADLKDVLDEMKFADVTIRIQHPGPSYMPSDTDDWSVSNVLVAATGVNPDVPTNYMLSVWFGPLREGGLGDTYFKSWGSPKLNPQNAPSIRDHQHQLMIGTPGFIAARMTLLAEHQGKESLWYVGGYSVDYDSQNSCLVSAKLAVAEILDKHALMASMEEQVFAVRNREVREVERGRCILSDPHLPENFALIDSVQGTLVNLLPHNPAVIAWNGGPPLDRPRRRDRPRRPEPKDSR